jgi:amino-acid N-acetyltransferase
MTIANRFANEADWPAIERLLSDSDLPLDGAHDHLQGFVVAEEGGDVVGCGALERYGSHALLRSVVVAPQLRGTRIGEGLVRDLLESARAQSIDTVVLLTTTAADWFRRFGFRQIIPEAVPPELTQSLEFRGACPDTAIVMSVNMRR